MPLHLPSEIDGYTAAGSVRLSFILPEPVLVQGASYKVVKTITFQACNGEPWGLEERVLARMSPLIDSRGRRLLPHRKGWARSPWTPRPALVQGPVSLELGWIGQGARFVESLATCLEDAVEGLKVDWLLAEPLNHEPARGAWVRIVTPAQVKFHGYILPCPPAWRLLRRPLELAGAGEEGLREMAWLLEAVDARYERVTVYFDEERPTNWAITGSARVVLSQHAGEEHMRLLGDALKIARHMGVGKSRLEGLGTVRVEPLPGEPGAGLGG